MDVHRTNEQMQFTRRNDGNDANVVSFLKERFIDAISVLVGVLQTTSGLDKLAVAFSKTSEAAHLPALHDTLAFAVEASKLCPMSLEMYLQVHCFPF